jgi:hypothetical protein
MAKTQRRVMEMERHESQAIVNKRCTILDIVTLMEKDIKIPNLKQFMWTKQNNDKHVE